MCEQAPAVVYCVGYVLPIGCCAAGACMSCYGCYRYYYATRLRAQRAHNLVQNFGAANVEQPKIKRDTLKSRMTEAFLNFIGGGNESTVQNGPDTKVLSLKDMEDMCPICIQEYESDTSKEFIGLLKGCGHYFHFECIWEWLERKQTCPICRESCQLSEKDIRGLSLQQVLKFAGDNSVVAVHPSSSKALEAGLTTEEPSTSTEQSEVSSDTSSTQNITQSLPNIHLELHEENTSTSDISEVSSGYGTDNLGFQGDNNSGNDVEIPVVVLSQPVRNIGPEFENKEQSDIQE